MHSYTKQPGRANIQETTKKPQKVGKIIPKTEQKHKRTR